MPPLRRHQLVYLTASGWAYALGRPWDTSAAELLRGWSQRGLPVVVSRQPEGMPQGDAAFGLPAPLNFGRRRIALQLPLSAIAWIDEFPPATAVLRLLRRPMRERVQSLLEGLGRLEAPARAYGSYGWQLLTGEAYLHANSDLDLWIRAENCGQADAVGALLQACTAESLRVDGELAFPGGKAVAWREWVEWRAGRTRGLLVKSLTQASIHYRLWSPSLNQMPEVAIA